MRDALIDLVRRMTLKESVQHSDDSASWHAHREAERLHDASLIGEIEGLLTLGRPKEERAALYFILGAIGQNTASPRCAEILLVNIQNESDKYVLSGLLANVAKVPKPETAQLGSVFSLLRNDRWLVRHAAIQALRNSKSASAEEELLAVLDTTSDPYDKIYCHATLNEIGTLRSVPLLTKSLTSKKRDVKASAKLALAAIQARSALEAESAAKGSRDA